MPSRAAFVLTLAGLALARVAPAAAQVEGEWPHDAVLERAYPDTYDVLVRMERAQGALLGALVGGLGDERDLVLRAAGWVTAEGRADELAGAADDGYAALGPRASELVAWTYGFLRNALGILADPDVTDRRAVLREAVERYRSHPLAALPSTAKDMDILYDHPHALAFRTEHPELAGFFWAGYWHRLAATEPLTDFTRADERAAGLDTVMHRYYAKLSDGEPPRSFPTQIPLAPAIAPGFIFLSPESAMIVDNLSMMLEVMADAVADPFGTDVRAALDEAVELFADPSRRMSVRGDWESMALRHGIFFQGGYPLDVMTRSELNGDPHAAHRGAAGARSMPMPVN